MKRLSPLARLIAGDPYRKTRIHDEKGNFVGLKYLLAHGPLCAASFVSLRLLRRRPTVPFIPYAAVRAIRNVLGKNSVVLEFGSGMSTVWLAERCEHVYSVEDSREWFAAVSDRLERHQLRNVTYALQTDRDEYVRFPADREGRLFDFILIDGLFREECLRHAVHRLKPGGYIYLDDVDKDMTVPNGEMRRVEATIRDVVAQGGGTLTYFTDFAMTHLVVKQGVLAYIP